MDVADARFAKTLPSEPPAELGQHPIGRKDGGQVEESDIYRGEPPSAPASPVPRPQTVSSSSSSSGWSGLGLRRGALGAVLELAINRWARATSGSSTSSSTSSSSVNTHLPRQRRRRSSNTTTENTHSEDVIRARRRARDEYRTLQREFILFIPAALMPPTINPGLLQGRPISPQSLPCRTLQTASLPLVLTQLDSTIKRSAKLRRPKQLRTASPGRALDPLLNDYMQLNHSSASSRGETMRRMKGKAREELRISNPPKIQVRAAVEQPQKKQAWWLDVSSPTWSDMREIGKVLHLHPLTLEDIVQQDPREKLELFPRLGYYFIVFRALGSEHTRASIRVETDTKVTNDTTPFHDSTILDSNVYVVVFRDGICTFHFEDIADHIERVRNKILKLEETVHMSSDWIAHGILDSIVDDFFPMLSSIEREIRDLDDLLLSDGQPSKKPLVQSQQEISASNYSPPQKPTHKASVEGSENKHSDAFASQRALMFEKPSGSDSSHWLPPSLGQLRTLFSVSNLNCRSYFPNRDGQASPSSSPLMRMASARRLVISLTRLLSTKSEVISQIRKRLTSGTSMSTSSGTFENTLTAEVDIYFGDIQDHILTLQHSLAHFERLLGHSHPAYLSHLRVSLSQAKGGMDKALLTLSVISVSVVAMQLVTGIFSVNLGHIPHNTRPPRDGGPHTPAPFFVFSAVLAGVILVGSSIVSLARYWWLRAKRKYARRPKFRRVAH